MSLNTYLFTSGVIFLIIAILHLLRLIYGWEAIIGGWNVPAWVSVVALIIAGYLGYEGLGQANGPDV